MLGRFFCGGVSVVAASTMLSQVAHAAEKPSDEKVRFLPVYDSDVTYTNAPLPGTIEASKPTEATELAQAESKVAQALCMENVDANGRTLRVSSLLEKYIGSARKFADSAIFKADETSTELSQKYRESERATVTTLANLKGADEDILPSAIYVLVAGLGGSITARRSNILLRLTLPWLFGGVAFSYFLPQTWANVRKLAWKYEQEQTPTIAQKHVETLNSLEHLKNESVEFYDKSEKSLASSLKSAHLKIKEWIGF